MDCSAEIAEADVSGLNEPGLSEPMPRVLIVDDEIEILECLEVTLGSHFRVETVSSSAKARKLIDHNTFDLIITDVKMPMVSGEELAGYIRENDLTTPILFISGHLDNSLLEENRVFSPSQLIQKPLPSRDQFIQIITDILKVDTAA